MAFNNVLTMLVSVTKFQTAKNTKLSYYLALDGSKYRCKNFTIHNKVENYTPDEKPRLQFGVILLVNNVPARR